jgi:CRP-like cAMP-binding protein
MRVQVSDREVETHQISSAWQGRAECRSCAIRSLVLFADLGEDDFDLIHRPIDELRLEAGTRLYRQGDAAADVFTLRSGLLKLVHHLPDGRWRIVRLLSRGDVAGLEALARQPYTHSALALDSTSVCRIPSAVVQRLSAETPRLHQQLMARWERSIQEADFWITALSTGPARARVARLLRWLAEQAAGSAFRLPSREDMGAMLAVTTETASRIIAEFKRSQYLQELDENRVRVDLPSLEKWVAD